MMYFISGIIGYLSQYFFNMSFYNDYKLLWRFLSFRILEYFIIDFEEVPKNYPLKNVLRAIQLV